MFSCYRRRMIEKLTDDDIERRIGALVRARRKAAGLTQSDVAQALGTSYQQIQKYEAGKNRISVSAMTRIAKALGTTAAEIVAEVEKG
jgi:transcriptional regulator with XRE-family HTH domain